MIGNSCCSAALNLQMQKLNQGQNELQSLYAHSLCFHYIFKKLINFFSMNADRSDLVSTALGSSKYEN